jgi:hypothetical protein
MTEPVTSNEPAHEFRQQEELIDRGWVAITAAILLPFLVVLGVAAKVLLGATSRPDAAQYVPTKPEPADRVSDIHSELFRRPLAGELLKEQQQKVLGRYGWVDRQHGLVRVPIDVAIELVANDAKERP